VPHALLGAQRVLFLFFAAFANFAFLLFFLRGPPW
jgi:hypothetical protein